MYKNPWQCTKCWCTHIMILATKVCICCDSCNTITHMFCFLHSSFSVAAATTHGQFWDLNLQYLRGRVFIYFIVNPKGNTISTGGRRIFVEYTSAPNMHYNFQVFDFEILEIITFLFTVLLHICRKSQQNNVTHHLFHSPLLLILIIQRNALNSSF